MDRIERGACHEHIACRRAGLPRARCDLVVHFLLLLPWLNPEFVTLTPPLITLMSKLLFALAMARALVVARDREPDVGIELGLNRSHVSAAEPRY